MKAALSVLGLIVVLGIVYGLAFLGVIPVQKMAAKNPSLAKILAPLHLAPAKKKISLAKTVSPPDPQQQALQTQQKQLAADRAQLDKDKAAFEAEKQPPPTLSSGATGPTPDGVAGPDTNAKLSAIYATMSPDDIANIFAKLPDPVVIQNLMPLDERKAGKVLAAMPPDRAARLSQLMMVKAPTQQVSAVPTQPQASLP